jgi:hypothetical protein
MAIYTDEAAHLARSSEGRVTAVRVIQRERLDRQTHTGDTGFAFTTSGAYTPVQLAHGEVEDAYE